MTVSTSRWGRYSWGPLLIGGGVVGRCCRVAEWPASVGWQFSDIGNWFPDIGKSSTFPDIGKSIPDIENHFPISGNRSFPDIGNWFPDIGNSNSRYRKIIPDIGKCWIKTQMAFHTIACITDWFAQRIGADLKEDFSGANGCSQMSDYQYGCLKYERWSNHSETLKWHLNERDGVSNHQPHDCVHNRLFRRRSKKASKLRVTGIYEGN